MWLLESFNFTYKHGRYYTSSWEFSYISWATWKFPRIFTVNCMLIWTYEHMTCILIGKEEILSTPDSIIVLKDWETFRNSAKKSWFSSYENAFFILIELDIAIVIIIRILCFALHLSCRPCSIRFWWIKIFCERCKLLKYI